MKYEQEYMPDETELEDVVHILKDGKSTVLEVPDDTEEPEDVDDD